MKPLVVFSRRGCHLCEVLVEELTELVGDRAEVRVEDIDTRPDWRQRYDTRIPVVTCDGKTVCQYHLDRDAVARLLDEHAA